MISDRDFKAARIILKLLRSTRTRYLVNTDDLIMKAIVRYMDNPDYNELVNASIHVDTSHTVKIAMMIELGLNLNDTYEKLHDRKRKIDLLLIMLYRLRNTVL